MQLLGRPRPTGDSVAYILCCLVSWSGDSDNSRLSYGHLVSCQNFCHTELSLQNFCHVELSSRGTFVLFVLSGLGHTF